MIIDKEPMRKHIQRTSKETSKTRDTKKKQNKNDRRHQQSYLTPTGQKGKSSETRTQKSSVTETYDSRRRDKSSEKRNRSNQSPPDQSSQQNRTRNSTIFTHKSNSTRTQKLEKSTSSEGTTILNRRAMLKLLDKFTNGDQIKSIDINIVEFAHKGWTDSIYLHITSQSVKKLMLQLTKEFSNRGYLLRETTLEERGQKSQKTNRTKQRHSHKDKTSETKNWIKNTPNRKHDLKEKRKYPSSTMNYEQTRKADREATYKFKGSNSTVTTRAKGKEKSREDHHIKRHWSDDDEDTEKIKTRKINGPIRTHEGTEKEKNTVREKASTQNRQDLMEKSSKRWAWLPQALTRYTGK
ncbi:micronuclear linker histone polyprotein-like [Ambystoma mexicanum]|uniref:micronuclear linker histone polyprotein-like n=1 Tax=Ambystoma mexicanum TaxID=8296 RepID=UPI0037E7F613